MATSRTSTASQVGPQSAPCRPGYLSGAPYARAYLRSVLAILVAIALYPIVIVRTAKRATFYPGGQWLPPGITYQEAFEAYQRLTIVDLDAGFLEAVVDAVVHIVTWLPMTALLVGGLAVTVLLEASRRR